MADQAEEQTNFYHPDGSETAGPLAASKSPKSSTVTWTASEFVEHNLGISWYLILFVATIVVTAGVYFITHDYFAVGITIMLGVIVAIYAGHKPRQVTYEVNATGLKVGERSYHYKDFKSFSINHEGALSTITFYSLKRLALPLAIFFDAKDEQRITEVIGEHLPLEKRGLDSFDALTRRLKL